MSLVTLQRSPESSELDFDLNQSQTVITSSIAPIAIATTTPIRTTQDSSIITTTTTTNDVSLCLTVNNYNNDDSLNLSVNNFKHYNLIEKYFVVKDAALILPKPNRNLINNLNVDAYCQTTSTTSTLQLTKLTGDILLHLREIVNLLRPHDVMSVVIKLNSYIKDHLRYLAIIETINKCNIEESSIIGFDIHQQTHHISIGLILPVYSNSELILDGDGGFKLQSYKSTIHIFKPISIQAMWYAYQYLHKKFDNARKYNFYSKNNSSHEWLDYYQVNIKKSEQYLINEWVQNEERGLQRDDFMTPYYCLTPTSPSTTAVVVTAATEATDATTAPTTTENDENFILNEIKRKIKHFMLTCKDDDYDSMNSLEIRKKLELELNMKLDVYKKYIDAIIFQYYNQLIECATCIVEPYLYLGSEWNASDYERLTSLNITHILNISNEVDNFFSDTFKYLNIRVQDIDSNDLLREFDRTYKFINEAKDQSSSCLVHCKMGISRSASVVIAYIMKEQNRSLNDAYQYVKQKRNCINPNKGFMHQLQTYESILNAHKSKYNLFEPQQASGTAATGPLPINRIKSTNDLITTSSQMIAALSSSSSPSSQSHQQSSIDSLRRCSSMKFKEAPKLDIKRASAYFIENPLPSTVFGSLGASVSFDLNEQSPPSSTIVRKLAEDFMKTQTSSSSLVLVNENSSSCESTTNVPSGLVRRQIHSIDTKSRPCTPEDDDQTTSQVDEPQQQQQTLQFDDFVEQEQLTHLQLIQSSPDSKRVKIENDGTAATSNFNKTKKVFEFLADKLKDENEDQQSLPEPPLPTLIEYTVSNHTSSHRNSISSTISTNSSGSGIGIGSASTRRRDLSKFHPLTILTSKTN